MEPSDGRDFIMPAAEAFEFGFDCYSGRRYNGAAQSDESLALIEEAPIALNYNGRPYAVMLATPTDLEDFALGFSLSEGIVAAVGDISELDVVPAREGVSIMVGIPAQDAERLEAYRRTVAGHGGCGLCGIENLRAAMRPPRCVGDTLRVTPAAIARSFADLPALQRLNAQTGAAHAAAFAGRDGGVVAAREDAGRHNALDKLIGHLARQRVDMRDGFLVMSSRGSCELALKACTAGFEMMASISAPTGLAVRIAVAAGLTLIGFARDGRFTCYAAPERVAAPGPGEV